MASYNDRDFLQHVAECNFSEEDLQFIRRTLRKKLIFWWLLTCIPGLGFYILPVVVRVWAEYKIYKQRTFEPRTGLLYGLHSLAMFITFILIIPIIIWAIVKRRSSVAGLMKKGLVGDGSHCVPRREAWKKIRRISRCVCVSVVIVITALIYGGLWLYGGYDGIAVGQLAFSAAVFFILLLLFGLIICAAVDSIRYKKYLRSE